MTSDQSSVRTITLGVLGCGTVGSAFCRLIGSESDTIATRSGLRLQVGSVAVRSLDADRGPHVEPSWLTTDPAAVIANPDVDVVVELIGGIEPARSLVLEALKAGKPVVTANKALLAKHGAELFAAAEANGVDLLFEAAVAGGIPLIRPLRESLMGERISRVMGIVNGTTNYILSQMSTHGAEYSDALAEAQRLGYAEADPTADVEGHDAGAKAAIIASIAFGAEVVADDVHLEGISKVTSADIEYGRKLGFAIKLLAVCELFDDDQVAVRVHPTMVPLDHPLAAVHDSFNAVFVEGAAVGDLMFYGRGAGGDPTASAVLGDVIDAAVNRTKGTHASIGQLARPVFRSLDDLVSRFYLNLQVTDEPGVLAEVAGVFGRNGVSIRSMEQSDLGENARLVFITHRAQEAAVRNTLAEVATLGALRSVGSVLRVIDHGD